MSLILPFGLAIAISPGPMVAAILLLTSNRGPRKWIAYLAGWLTTSITLVVTVLLFVSSQAPGPRSTVSQVTSWFILLAGIALLTVTYLQWHARSSPDTQSMFLDRLRAIPVATTFQAWSAGIFFGLFSAKNLLLTASAALLIGEARLGVNETIVAVMIFVVIATSGILATGCVALTRGAQSRTILTEWEHGLSTNHVTINCSVVVMVAAQLLGLGFDRIF